MYFISHIFSPVKKVDARSLGLEQKTRLPESGPERHEVPEQGYQEVPELFRVYRLTIVPQIPWGMKIT